MKFIKNVLSGIKKSPKAEKPPEFEVPSELPNLEKDSSEEAIQKMELPADVKQTMTQEDSPSSFLGNLLKDPQFAALSINYLAHGLDKKSALMWAASSASLGYEKWAENNPESPVPQEETAAIAATQAYLSEPTPEAALVANEAAQSAGHGGPGAWAAQGAAWDGESSQPGGEEQGDLVGKAVEGAVLLASALAAPDVEDPKVLEVPEEVPDGVAPEEVMDKELEPLPEPAELDQEPFIDNSPAEELPIDQAPLDELPKDQLPEEEPPLEEKVKHLNDLKPFIDEGLKIAAG